MKKKGTTSAKKASESDSGPLHSLQGEFRKAVHSSPDIKDAWEDLTPLARNEWICWVTSAKKDETRVKRIERAKKELVEGKRRPCCWPGCPHRRPSAAKWFKN